MCVYVRPKVISAGVPTADVHTNGNGNPCLSLELQRSQRGETSELTHLWMNVPPLRA